MKKMITKISVIKKKKKTKRLQEIIHYCWQLWRNSKNVPETQYDKYYGKNDIEKIR